MTPDRAPIQPDAPKYDDLDRLVVDFSNEPDGPIFDELLAKYPKAYPNLVTTTLMGLVVLNKDIPPYDPFQKTSLTPIDLDQIPGPLFAVAVSDSEQTHPFDSMISSEVVNAVYAQVQARRTQEQPKNNPRTTQEQRTN